jgi:hypothetical protein
MTIKAAASQAGISESTYYRWFEESEEWAEECIAAIRFSEAVLLAKLDRCAEDKLDWRAYAWRLQKRFPDEYGDHKKLEMNVAQQSDGSQEVLSMMQQLEASMNKENSISLSDGVNKEED